MSKNTQINNIEGLFNVTTNLVADNTEIRRLEWGSHSWTRSTLFNDRAIQLTKAKVYVYSDSVLCLGGIYTTGDAIEQWKGQVATCREENHSFNELWEWMENQLNSSGNFSQDSPNCRFFTPSNATWWGPTSNRKNSVIESSLCPCSTTRHLQERKWGFLYFDIHQSSRTCFKIVCVKRYWAFIGPGNEDKWFRRYDSKPEGKWDSTASKNGETVRRNRTSCIQRDKCIESWEMRKRKNKDTIHYNGESVIVELLLSDYAHSESALCLRSSHILAWNAGKNGIRESVEKSEHEHWGNQFFGEDTTSTTSFGEPNASETSKFLSLFQRKVNSYIFMEEQYFIIQWRGLSVISRSGADDGCGNLTPMCREHPHPRELPGSRCFATINANTQIGPVLNAHISKLCGIHGIEVQFQSLSQPDCSSWILICRGLERFVEESHSYDSEIHTPSTSLLKPKNDPEHVVMAPETPSTGRRVHGRQDSKRNERTVILHATGIRCIQERFSIHGTFINSKPLYTGDRYKNLYKERSYYARQEGGHDSCSSLK